MELRHFVLINISDSVLPMVLIFGIVPYIVYKVTALGIFFFIFEPCKHLLVRTHSGFYTFIIFKWQAYGWGIVY